MSIAQPLKVSGLGVDFVGAIFGGRGPCIFDLRPTTEIFLCGLEFGRDPAFFGTGLEKFAWRKAVIVNQQLDFALLFEICFALNGPWIRFGTPCVDISLANSDGFSGKTYESFDVVDVGFFRVFEHDDIVTVVGGNLFIDDDSVPVEHGGIKHFILVSTVRADRLANAVVGQKLSAVLIDFLAGTDRVIQAAAAAGDFFVSTVQSWCHRACRDHKRLGFEGFEDESEDERDDDRFDGFSQPFFAGDRLFPRGVLFRDEFSERHACHDGLLQSVKSGNPGQ